ACGGRRAGDAIPGGVKASDVCGRERPNPYTHHAPAWSLADRAPDVNPSGRRALWTGGVVRSAAEYNARQEQQPHDQPRPAHAALHFRAAAYSASSAAVSSSRQANSTASPQSCGATPSGAGGTCQPLVAAFQAYSATWP